jgi:hypothetical protein
MTEYRLDSRTTEEALDARCCTGPFLLEGFQVPGQMAVILGLHRGRLDPLPPLTLTLSLPHQHAQQLAHISPIALGPTLTPIDLHRGGIHHRVGDPLGL